jgi:hypothetical protein
VRDVPDRAERHPESVEIKQANRLLMPRADLVQRSEGGSSGLEGQRSLRDWAAMLAARSHGAAGVSARDLVFDPRAERAGR